MRERLHRHSKNIPRTSASAWNQFALIAAKSTGYRLYCRSPMRGDIQSFRVRLFTYAQADGLVDN